MFKKIFLKSCNSKRTRIWEGRAGQLHLRGTHIAFIMQNIFPFDLESVVFPKAGNCITQSLENAPPGIGMFQKTGRRKETACIEQVL